MTRTVISMACLLALAGSPVGGLAQEDRTPTQIKETVERLFNSWARRSDERPDESSEAEKYVEQNKAKLPYIDDTLWQEGEFTFAHPSTLRWVVDPKDPKPVSAAVHAATVTSLKTMLVAARDRQLRQDAYIAANSNYLTVDAQYTAKIEGGEPPRPSSEPAAAIVCVPCRRGCLWKRWACCCVPMATTCCTPQGPCSVQCCDASPPGPVQKAAVPSAGEEPRVSRSVLRSVARTTPGPVVGAPALPAATKPPLSAQDVVRRLTGAQGPVFVSVSAPRPVASGVPSELVRDLYMLGYHAYWSGQPQKALDSLDQAVSFGADDARSWYYKGFAELDMGRREEAEKSLARAVQLHAQRPTDVAIAKSLERVQGRLRVELQLALSLVRKLKPSDVESSLLVVK